MPLEPCFGIMKIAMNSTRIQCMVYIATLPIYGDSSVVMDLSLNCSRVIMHLADRSGQNGYLYDLYDYQLTSGHSCI